MTGSALGGRYFSWLRGRGEGQPVWTSLRTGRGEERRASESEIGKGETLGTQLRKRLSPRDGARESR